VSQANALNLLKQGIAAAKAGNKPLARHLLRKATELEPGNELAWLWLAGVTDSLEEVVACMQRVLEVNPTNERALAGLQWARAQMARRTPLWRCPLCQAASPQQVGKCPACGAILTLTDLEALLGNADVNQKQVRAAIERYGKIPADEADSDVHYNLGLACLNLKQIDEGLRHLQAALRLRPDDTVLRAQVGVLSRRQAAAQAAAWEQKKQVSRGMVLVVDDSPTVCRLVSITLEKQGYRVAVAHDGLEALARINDGLPDLILLDIMMPRLDGYQVCKIIKGNEETRDIPVVMLSGKDGFFDKVRGRMVGSTEYITKPFEPDVLVQVMEKHMNNQKG
jgi:twitching motility two-component system response regulator PilG